MIKLKTVLALAIVMGLMLITMGGSCNSDSGGGGSDQPDVACKSNMSGNWSFVGSTSGGTLTFDGAGNVSGISQSGACSGFALTGTSSSHYKGYPIIVNYTVRCGDGKTYTYELSLSPVGGDCNKLSGNKRGSYSGGITENMVLQKK